MSAGLTLRGARVLWPDGFGTGDLSLAEGVIGPSARPRVVDLSGFLILPGIVDAHGDGFERHLAPRPSAPFPSEVGLNSFGLFVEVKGKSW
jgi:alpha-D-ribose 1-methylphosphonate 5-triphosphate diphosphatase